MLTFTINLMGDLKVYLGYNYFWCTIEAARETSARKIRKGKWE